MPRESTSVPVAVRTVAHLDQYFGLWAMEESRLNAQVARVGAMDMPAHIAANSIEIGRPQAWDDDGDERPRSTAERRGYAIDRSGVAVVDCVGMMTKYGSSLSLNKGTLALRRAVRAAADDNSVRGIMVRIDSPGGAVAGTGDLARDIAEAAAVKPVHAYIEDLGASAAYWLASQSSFISANQGGIVGSIGTYTVIYDMSAAAEKDGIKVHVVRAGEFKGAGTPGTEVTDAQLAEWQRQIDALNALFVADVAKGRRISLEQAQALNDGRVHIGDAAKKAGLIDAVESWDQAMQRLERAIEARHPVTARHTGTTRNSSSHSGKGQTMSSTETAAPPARGAKDDTSTQPQSPAAAAPAAAPPATIAQLKAKFPRSSAEFRERCLEQGLTLGDAAVAYAAELESENSTLKADAAKAANQPAANPAANPAAAARRRGVEPVGAGISAKKDGAEAEGSGDARADFGALIEKIQADQVNAGRPPLSRISATVLAAKANPDLHRRYLLATNPKRTHALINGRFDDEE